MDGQDNQQDADDEELMIPITTLTKISNYVDRYFLRFYRVYTGMQGQCLNQLCLVGLAPEHEIIAMKKKVTKVSYDKVYSGDMQNLVKGKKKKGGVKSNPGKTIGEIFCEDGSVYEIKGVVDGVVIELNDNLFRNPQWVTDYADNKGFIGIINIGKKTKLSNKDVLNPEEYKQVLEGADLETILKAKKQQALEEKNHPTLEVAENKDEMNEEEDNA